MYLSPRAAFVRNLLDPYQGCLHEGSERHAALASDLIEEFRAPLIDSLVLYLVNNGTLKTDLHFQFHDGGCFLNESGRRCFLQAFVQRMEEEITVDNQLHPRWHLLLRQVKCYKRFVYAPSKGYEPYRIR
ncbi:MULTISPECIES: CRISPR-associated endonuclease Cas1 [unclassified Synechocystis]|uniref:CRISPR-associated endonuclease Cas1 n=1 Tax=unclassified Synechocystis TaxID=2640012 RepID=UPI000410A4D4|nr:MULTISPECIES: CRISPR-associated endonuclease Cas1 [unclassified Synechocystis]AIE73550.1 CRISPR-associated protein Cas1 [Synechocystis sp. PCC 6714]MCT0254115.1 CRISPR-associated endonuclease Cas1 [Synechocystis sp. CS-94]